MCGFLSLMLLLQLSNVSNVIIIYLWGEVMIRPIVLMMVFLSVPYACTTHVFPFFIHFLPWITYYMPVVLWIKADVSIH